MDRNIIGFKESNRPLIMCVGKLKTLIKLDAWLFYELEISEREILLCIALITFFILFSTFLHHILIFYRNQPH